MAAEKERRKRGRTAENSEINAINELLVEAEKEEKKRRRKAENT